MFKIVLVAALAALAVDARFLSRAPQLDGRIVGGDDANIEDYPYHVSVQISGQHICGGSIIGRVRNIILTAAHCLVDRSGTTISTGAISVRYGTSLMQQGGTVINVAEVFQDSRYNPLTIDYDISLLKLVGNVLLSPQVQPIFLVSSDGKEGGRSAKITGWGQLYAGGPLSERLQVVEVQEVERNACNSSHYGAITERMICFIGEGKGICGRDSGGPLVARNGFVTNQIGVASWVRGGCANARYPGVYTNIHSREIIDFIVPILGEHGTD